MGDVHIRPAAAPDTTPIARLWAACTDGPRALLYRRLSAEEIDAMFVRPSDGFAKVSLVAHDGDRVVGFANGTHRPGGEQAYVTVVLVDEAYRRQGIGRRLLAGLESALVDAARPTELTKFEVVFFNPITLTWIIPGTGGHDHPNSPGVDVACDGYIFLKNQGYHDFAYQNSYYLRLSDYHYPESIQRTIERLAADGIRITTYDPSRHVGLDELFDDLGNEEWREIVTSNFTSGGPANPVLIVEDGDRACGFTGPMYVQPSGRGYFAGIGVHSDYRGRGAGKVLFSALCMGLKGIGAQFMSLFTGETNPARNIYEAAGFRIVRSWVDMRKLRDTGGTR